MAYARFYLYPPHQPHHHHHLAGCELRVRLGRDIDLIPGPNEATSLVIIVLSPYYSFR